MAYNLAMTFWEHLEELRRRIIISAVAVVVLSVASLSFSQPIEKLLRLPLEVSVNTILATLIDHTVGSEGSIMGFLSLSLRASATSVNATLFKVGPVEGIMVYFKISMICGILLASPIVLYQIWAFIFPALTQHEKRFAFPLFLIILLFFVVGAIFAYFIVAPVALQFSARLFANLDNLWDLEKYVKFLTGLMLGFGIAFELPIVMAFLSGIGVINARGYQERQRYAIVGIFVMAALVTPTTDAFTMLLMAIPLILLYQLGIFLAFLVEKEPESYA